MNKIDKEWYEALRFLSRLTTKKAKHEKSHNLKDFRRYVLEDVENTLHQFGYIQWNESITQVVTQNGLQQLRDLEEIERKDLTIFYAVLAIVISLISLAKSFGWFG
ncbi:MAG: hypothetical protein WD512_19060 [Candidatus Paceibacterota bacterium]